MQTAQILTFIFSGFDFRDEIEEVADPPDCNYDAAFDADAFFAMAPPAFDLVPPSQLYDAPIPTQDPDCTPQPTPRPTRQVRPPDVLSYPTDHVRVRRGRRPPRPDRDAAPKRGRQ